MQLFYTGADKYNVQQIDASKSLGGLMSSSLIPNNLLGNLFPSVSNQSIVNNTSEYRAIIIKNDTNAPLINLKIYLTYPDNNQCKLEVAAVTISSDANGNKSMERITSPYAQPYYGNFVEPIGVDNSALLSNSFAAGALLGIWIKRTIIPANITTQFDNSVNNDTTLLLQETLNLQLMWD